MKMTFQTAPALLRGRFAKTRRLLVAARLMPVVTVSLHKTIKKKNTGWRKALRILCIALMTLSLSVAAVLFVPDVYYRIFSADTQPVQATNNVIVATPSAQVEERKLPPYDSSLPDGEWVVIPRIGVRSQPMATEDPEEALKKGIWLVPEYGRAGDTDIPIILAAHRYGWQWWWKTDYWKYNSFYYLPELEVGDRVEIISDHRKWVYEIYAAEEGQEITDYEADLILYTCKLLNSPIRHFRYARLLPIEE